MKKISIISPVFNKVDKISTVGTELLDFFKDKYNFEVFYYYSGDLKDNFLNDYHFNYLKVSNNHNFNDCVIDGFNKANGDCIIVADLNDADYLDYIIKLLVEWEAKAQVVLVKKNRSETFFGKIKNFFAKIVHKIYDWLLSFIGLHTDVCAYKNFQLFSKEVAQVIKSLPEKNYYLRHFDCWVDYRVSILYTNKKVKVNKKVKFFNKDLIYSLISFGLTIASVVLVAVGANFVSASTVASFVLIGGGLSVCLGVFALFCFYRWFIYKRTLMNINMK